LIRSAKPSAKVEGQDDLVVLVAVAGRAEAKALIERPGLTVALGVTRQQLGGTFGAQDFGDEAPATVPTKRCCSGDTRSATTADRFASVISWRVI
jgi:hypothetical protein